MNLKEVQKIILPANMYETISALNPPSISKCINGFSHTHPPMPEMVEELFKRNFLSIPLSLPEDMNASSTISARTFGFV